MFTIATYLVRSRKLKKVYDIKGEGVRNAILENMNKKVMNIYISCIVRKLWNVLCQCHIHKYCNSLGNIPSMV